MWGLLLALSTLSSDVGVDQTDTLVICPPRLHAAMRPWMNYREAQGRSVKVADPPSTAKELQALVRDVVRAHSGIKWVVLVGDAGPGPHSTPTHIVDAKVNIHFGSEPEIATDNPTADIDDDGVPDLAIGRLTADTPEELSRMIAKVIRYEQHSPGAWKRRINFVAGVGGFGFVDTIIETVTKRFLTDGIPAHYYTTMTYGSWKSVYCPSPPSFHAATIERLNEGCLFWVYIGHGNRYTLDKINVPGSRHHILDVRDMAKLKARNGPAIAIMLACYTGAFDSPHDCIAEEMVRADGGPVAALAGSRVTMPYAMSVLANGLLEQHFVNRRGTLGEVLMHAKRGLADKPAVLSKDTRAADEKGKTDNPLARNRQLLDMLANAVSPKPELVRAERIEHLALFNLIGDPLLALRHPSPVDVASPKEWKAGQPMTVKGECKDVGRLRLELVCQRDCQKVKAPSRGPYVESTLAMREFDRTYVLANDRQWASTEVGHQGGKFEIQLDVPRGCKGPCYVRAFLDGKTHAMGSSAVFVRPASLRAAAATADVLPADVLPGGK